MKWPWVSRSLFEYQEREILELRHDLANLRHDYRRTVDEINFRSSGFHLYEEFAKKAEPAEVVAPVPVAAGRQHPIDEAVSSVGTRMTAVRQYLERSSESALQQKEKQWAEGAESRRQAEQASRAADMLEKALHKGEERAAQA